MAVEKKNVILINPGHTKKILKRAAINISKMEEKPEKHQHGWLNVKTADEKEKEAAKPKGDWSHFHDPEEWSEETVRLQEEAAEEMNWPEDKILKKSHAQFYPGKSYSNWASVKFTRSVLKYLQMGSKFSPVQVSLSQRPSNECNVSVDNEEIKILKFSYLI